MDISYSVVKDVAKSVWGTVKAQWKGFTIGAVMCASIFMYVYINHWKPILNEYGDLGQHMGTYRIVKGTHVVVDATILGITFDSHVYCKTNGDSSICYPFLTFRGPTFDRWYGTSYERFQVGRRMHFKYDGYYYTAELSDIVLESDDTVGIFNIFRKELADRGKP